MQISYELTERDFLDAILAHRKSKPLQRWGFTLIVVVGIVFLILSATAIAVRPNVQNIANVLPAFGVGLFWVLLVWGGPRLTARKQFRGQPGAQGLRILSTSDSGLHLQTSTAIADVSWGNYVRWTESKNVFSVYSSPVMFNMIPKRAFNPEQLAEFRQMLEQRVGPKNKQRKALPN